MRTFKKGDVCVLVRSPCLGNDMKLATRIGQECEVEQESDAPLAMLATEITKGAHRYFRVRFADGKAEEVCHSMLRHKKPPQPKSDWSLIEKITGWLPRPLIPEVA